LIHKAWLVVGVTVLLGLTACRKAPAEAKDAKKDAKDSALPVEVTNVALGCIEATIRNSTHLEVEEEVKVFARTANRVTELLVEEGDLVKKGQVLLRLDNDIQKTAHAKAQTNLEKTQQEYARQKALFEGKLISEQVFKDIGFQLKQQELAFEDARRELDYTEVRAPIDGTISQRLVNYGDLVNLNQQLFQIVDFRSIVARIYVPEKNLQEVRLDQPARVITTALGANEFTGYVKRISPVIESKTGTVKVTVGFKDVGELRPGMYVDVELVTARHTNALLITKRALLYDGELSFVFRLLPERKVERVLVEPRVADKFNVEPVSGFKEGDQIVIAGQTGLKDGAKVRLPSDPQPEEKKQEKKDSVVAKK